MFDESCKISSWNLSALISTSSIFLTLLCPKILHGASVSTDVEPLIFLSAQDQIYSINVAPSYSDGREDSNIDQIISKDLTNSINWKELSLVNTGYSESALWIKLFMFNPNPDQRSWILEQQYSQIQLIEVHIRHTDFSEDFRAGRAISFFDRPIFVRNPAFPIKLRPHEKVTVYIKIKTQGPRTIALRLMEKDQFITRISRELVFLGAYFGLMVAMIAYNLLLFCWTRDQHYFYYVCYAVCFFCLQCWYMGVAHQFFWPNYPKWNNVSGSIFVGSSYFFLTVFFRLFLNSKTSKIANLFLKGAVGGAVFIVVMTCVHYCTWLSRFNACYMIVVSLLYFSTSVYFKYQGSKNAHYFIVAFGCLILAIFTTGLKDFGFVSVNTFVLYVLPIGSCLEMMLLSLALASRINLLKEEHNLAREQIVKKDAEIKRQESLVNLSSQVAHDIRSPLAALNMLEMDSEILPEDKRILMRSAIGRIRDIANQLLAKNKIVQNISIEGSSYELQSSRPQLLLSILEGIISEKRMQFRSKIGIKIEAVVNRTSYGKFSSIQLTEFKRMLSNLMNNSIESLADEGVVTIELEQAPAGMVQIKVQDNGKGVPPEILAKIGQKGATFGKEGGSGLGLFHAKTTVESWGGKLLVDSDVDKGTAVTLLLPECEAPAWFVNELCLDRSSVVVVLDDDESIHKIWERRAQESQTSLFGIKWQHFSTPCELRTFQMKFKNGKSVQYLLDYELLGFKETGLDLVEELNIGKQSILVTSRFEEADILERCNQLKIKLIPKGMAGFVPIQIKKEILTESRFSAVLIDDDALVHMSWKMAANQAGQSFIGFNDPSKFFAAASQFDHTIPIFIDSFLGTDTEGNELRGEEIAYAISKLGFKHIYLATGFPADRIEPRPWILGIRGKNPPWSGKENCAIS